MTAARVRTIKDRAKDFPELEYLCESIVIRIQTHCAKPISEKRIDFTKETELPVIAHMPFGVSEEFVKAIKDSGVDKATIVSAGWNYGGYDGRTPSHFPVEITVGGEDGLKRLCQKVREMGYQFTLHATNTDGYTVSPMWNPDWGRQTRRRLFRRRRTLGGRQLLQCLPKLLVAQVGSRRA